MKYKRNLIRCLAFRARSICSEECVEKELQIIRDILSENGYPEKFIKANIGYNSRKHELTTVEKKPLFLRLQFKGDTPAEILSQRLTRAIKKTFYSARLCLSFTSPPMFTQQLKDALPNLSSSSCIYHFNCSCGSSYIGRTIRQVRLRVREHLPAWFSGGEIKCIKSSILSHLVDTGHRIDVNTAFRVIYRIPKSLSRTVRLRLLHIAEAVAIRSTKPELCIQKEHVQTLFLPWPTLD
uniref:Helix-turn-helix domain-containing protein n=1 Tax=Trichobilharzia regenti TaxID=157069 RepID=A0AA85KI04_TRIRE|nr:unnamed protein product [Trichobilharzia regenti]